MDEAALGTIRNKLRDFYGVLKQSTDDIRFAFITGIAKFSQLSIFSAMSNLVSISMSNEYASICGITKEELLTALSKEVRNMAQTLNISESTALAKLKKKYDGYHFSKNLPIYTIRSACFVA